MKVDIFFVNISIMVLVFSLNSCQSKSNLDLIHKSIESFSYNDSVIVVKEKKLMWAASDSPVDINLSDANEYCFKFHGGGFDDWRLPTLGELIELYSSDLWERSHKENTKINIHWRIWSSDIDYHKGKPQSFAVMSFYGGKQHYVHKNTTSFLRALPVRDL